jgi:hypothetical protein
VIDAGALAHHMQGLRDLAMAIICQAFLDATLAETPCPRPDAQKDAHPRWEEANRYRQEARTFLTTANPVLEFWCRIAGVSENSVLRAGRKADWDALRELHAMHPRNAVALLHTLDAETKVEPDDPF